MPNVSNATVATGTGLSTAGNGGRKLVRLSNGVMFSLLKNAGTSYIYKSTDNGNTWVQFKTLSAGSLQDNALATNGVHLYVGEAINNSSFRVVAVDASTGAVTISTLDNASQSALGNVSLAINEAGTELHAAWSSKNATYPNSFNIRYAKGTINPDGSVTWGAVEQVTAYNSTTRYVDAPSISIRGDGYPVIVMQYYDGASDNGITSVIRDATGWYFWNGSRTSAGSGSLIRTIASGINGYKQYAPASLMTPTAINGLANGRLWVAWHGKDATDSAKFNVRVSYSDDGGLTWVTPVKLTSGNLYDRQNVTLAADKTGKVFALYEEHQWSPDLDIYMRTYNGSWGAPVAVAEADPAAESNPSALLDYSLQMTTPPFVFMSGTDGIKFSGNFNVGASVSPASGSLGSKETPTITAYTVTPENGSTVTQIVEKLNGVTLNTYNNPASLSRTFTVPQVNWDGITFWQSQTTEIIVTDSNGATTTTAYTFVKSLADNAPLLEGVAATEDAYERISDKRDALAAQVGLSAGSTFDEISTQLASGTAYKKFATGTVTSGGSQLPFVYQTGSTLNNYFVTVSGLNFLPKTIIVFATSNQPQTFYVDGLRWNGVAGQDTLMSQTLNYFRTTGNLYVTDSGFRLPVSNTAITYSWIAYG